MISIDDFKKVDIRIGRIVSAEKVENADKLLKLSVDLGEEAPRQIVSGIAEYFPDPTVLIGRECPFVTNLEPRVIRGIESNGMILAVGAPEGVFALLHPDREVLPGSSGK
jgi:methionine--tRNA ligase beta chain